MVVALTSAGAAVTVALINNVFASRQRKKDNIAGRMSAIEDNQLELVDKVELNNKGTMTGLKIQLQATYDKQRRKVSSRNDHWSPDLDQVFREAYKSYKDLGGNGIIDRLKGDMDIWRDKYAGNLYRKNK